MSTVTDRRTESDIPRSAHKGASITKLALTALTGIGVAGAAGIWAAPLAGPAGHQEPGSSCQSGDLGKSGKSHVGTPVRCIATSQGGYRWVSDSGAADVIKHLQDEGYAVTIERVGHHALEQCEVTGVFNPQTITRTDRSGGSSPGDHPVTTIVSQTITVALDCN